MSDKIKILFLPYKVAMWDSLESIWQTAMLDERCQVSVVPIPYFEKNPDGSFGKMYYDGDIFPSEISVISYNDYKLESERPDIIYIHNPYDNANNATSVVPEYYSKNLKEYTRKLVYVPYYVTAGNTSDAQSLLPAYIHADYVVLQAMETKCFIDDVIPREKLLPLGSPKIDRIIKICSEPLKNLPDSWSEKISGKKVYFYNTSLGGMLADTGAFLSKMSYVFECFSKVEDACLLWRPHPLLESSFKSMRPEWFPIYEKLKQYFLNKNLGILDTMPGIEMAIAVSDAYVGDAATSVTALFGAVGKEMFILDNRIDRIPAKDDWRGQVLFLQNASSASKWLLFRNSLFKSCEGFYDFDKRIQLNDYNGGGYYIGVVDKTKKTYVCPGNAQNILVINDDIITGCIELQKNGVKTQQFYGVIEADKYIFLLPDNYPYLVRIDTEDDSVDYVSTASLKDFFSQIVDGDRMMAACAVWEEYLLISSIVDDRIIAINIYTLEETQLQLGIEEYPGTIYMLVKNNRVWLLPVRGDEVICFMPGSGDVIRYKGMPEGFCCNYRLTGMECMERPFSSVAATDDSIYLSPLWGNMFVKININTGDVSEWKPTFPVSTADKSCYYKTGAKGYFINNVKDGIAPEYRYFSYADRRLYIVDFDGGKSYEIEIKLEENLVKEAIKGFCTDSKWLGYSCVEDSFNSLVNFIKGEIVGSEYDRNIQLQDFANRVANGDGSAGIKIHEYIMKTLNI